MTDRKVAKKTRLPEVGVDTQVVTLLPARARGVFRAWSGGTGGAGGGTRRTSLRAGRGGGARTGAVRGGNAPAETGKMGVFLEDKVRDLDNLLSAEGAKGRSSGGLSSSERWGGVVVADLVIDGVERVVEDCAEGEGGASGEVVGIKGSEVEERVAMGGVVVKVSPCGAGDAAPEDVAKFVLVVPAKVASGRGFPRARCGSQGAVANQNGGSQNAGRGDVGDRLEVPEPVLRKALGGSLGGAELDDPATGQVGVREGVAGEVTVVGATGFHVVLGAGVDVGLELFPGVGDGDDGFTPVVQIVAIEESQAVFVEESAVNSTAADVVLL